MGLGKFLNNVVQYTPGNALAPGVFDNLTGETARRQAEAQNSRVEAFRGQMKQAGAEPLAYGAEANQNLRQIMEQGDQMSRMQNQGDQNQVAKQMAASQGGLGIRAAMMAGQGQQLAQKQAADSTNEYGQNNALQTQTLGGMQRNDMTQRSLRADALARAYSAQFDKRDADAEQDAVAMNNVMTIGKFAAGL